MHEFSDNNFEAEVLESDVPVLVDFWAPWCGPCRQLSPIVEEISEERTDLKVGKLNTDENSETSLKYSILSIPSLLIFQNGKEVKRISGVYPKHKINETINSVLTGGE